MILLVTAGHHDGVFIVRARGESRQKNLPKSAVAQAHRMARAIPTVVIAGDADHLGVGSPYREANALHPFAGDHVRPQRAVAFVVGALAMQVQFERSQQRREAIGILQFLLTRPSTA